MSELKESIERLKAAVQTPERRRELFDEWLAKWAEDKKRLPREITDAERSSLYVEFESHLLAQVMPTDVLVACAVAEPSTIVRDLELGSTHARKVKADGTPNRVWILTRQLEHLLAQIPAE